jgi:heme oxygenase
MPTDFRTALASATRAAHEEIERELALDGEVPLARYIAYLRSMHAVVSGFEQALVEDRDFAHLGFHARRKRPWLERDLRHFGVAGDVSNASPPVDFAARVGWAYVLEGATLGGRVLYKRLAPLWSLTPEHGGSFLFGYGERTAEMWRSFVEALNALDFTAAQKEACAAGAAQAFRAIAEAFRASIAGAHLGIGMQDRRLGAA